MRRRMSTNAIGVITVAVVGAALGIGLSWVIAPESSPPVGEIRQQAAATTTTADPQQVVATQPPTDDAQLIYVIGDSYTGGSLMDSGPNYHWPRVMAAAMNRGGRRVDFEADGVGGSGYVNGADSGVAFPDRVDQVDPDADLVIVFGSRNDGGRADAAAIADVATATFDEIMSVAPGAELLVIAPPWIDENVPDTIVQLRDGLEAAAASVGATFLDPIEDGWFFGADAALIGDDGVHPTNEGHEYMADRIRPVAEALLGG